MKRRTLFHKVVSLPLSVRPTWEPGHTQDGKRDGKCGEVAQGFGGNRGESREEKVEGGEGGKKRWESERERGKVNSLEQSDVTQLPCSFIPPTQRLCGPRREEGGRGEGGREG